MFRVNPVNLKSVSVYCDDVHCVYNGELNDDDLKNAMSFENSIMRGASLSQVNASNDFEFEFEDMIVRGLKNEYDCWYDDADYQCVCYECTKEMKSYIKSGLLFEYDNHVYPLNCGYHMKCENVKKAISTCLVSHGYLLKSEDLSIYYCNEKICEGESLQSVGVGKNDVLYVLSSGVVNRVNDTRLNELMFSDVNDFVAKALNNDLNEVNHLILRMSDDVDVRNVLNDLIGCCLPNVVVLSLLSEDDEIVKSFLNHPCFPCLSRVFVYSEYVDEIENTLELNDYEVKTNQIGGLDNANFCISDFHMGDESSSLSYEHSVVNGIYYHITSNNTVCTINNIPCTDKCIMYKRIHGFRYHEVNEKESGTSINVHSYNGKTLKMIVHFALKGDDLKDCFIRVCFYNSSD